MSVQSMSLAEKVGQLFIVSIDGTSIDGKMIHLLKNCHIGGVLYTEGNVIKPKQVHRLSASLQAYANHQLFIAAKQNGASANTIMEGVTISPGQRTLGAIHNRLYTKQAARIIGSELRAIGINMNIAPALHLDERDEHSFSNQQDHVAKHGRAMIEGYHKSNVLAAAGVFPNQLDQIIANKPLYKTAIQPYAYAIAYGLQALLVNDVQEAHSFLREKLHYTGLLMKNLEADTHTENDAIHSFQSGADMLILRGSYASQRKQIDSVLEAVKNGELAEEKVSAAVDRILQVKKEFRIGDTGENFQANRLRQKRHISFIEKIYALHEKEVQA